MAVFVKKKKKTWPKCQKVIPLTTTVCLPVTALALSARRPFGPARFARGGWIKRHRARYIFGFDLYDISINKKTQVEVILEKDLVFDLFLSTAIFSGRPGSLTWHPISTACTADRRARRAVTGTYYLLLANKTDYLH